MITASGRLLIDAHRRSQVGISAEATGVLTNLWQEYGDTPLWVPMAVQVVRHFSNRSTALALQYLRSYRYVEIGRNDLAEVPHEIDTARTGGLMWVVGPGLVQQMIGLGSEPSAAKTYATWKVINAGQKIIMDGGRNTIMDSALANDQAAGFHRVTDGNPCTFCAMIAARQGVYRSEAAARNAKRWHGHCGCTVAEVFGDYEPTDQERRYASVIESARAPGMTEAALLSAMRADGDFRDSTRS